MTVWQLAQNSERAKKSRFSPVCKRFGTTSPHRAETHQALLEDQGGVPFFPPSAFPYPSRQ